MDDDTILGVQLYDVKAARWVGWDGGLQATPATMCADPAFCNMRYSTAVLTYTKALGVRQGPRNATLLTLVERALRV